MTDTVQFDVVIIGSGLGGLQCANILSREGFNVCVLEKNAQIGGCLQNFTRDKTVFDTGIHYIGGLDEGQVLNRYFRYFGLMDKLNLKRMDQDAFDIVRFENDPVDYPYAMGHPNFVKQLLKYFPKEEEALTTYSAKMQYICNHFPLYNLSHKSLEISETQLFSENACEFIHSLTTDRKLRNVLAGTNPLYAGLASKTPLYVHALVTNSFIESSWKVVDGSSAIADVFEHSVREAGGTILRKAFAQKFVFTGQELTGVQLADGRIIRGKHFISDIHPARTLGLIGEGYLRKAYRERIMELENTTSNFTLYVVFHKESFPYLNYNLYYYQNEDVWNASVYDPADWPENFLLITPANSRSESWAEGATIMTYMDFKDVRQWEDTGIERRGEDYLNFKHQKAEQLLDLVERRYPGFRKTVKKYYTSTPLTYRDYTGTPEGSLYGIMRNCNDPLRTLISPKTKIPNLYLTGQNIILHGVLGVTIAAVTTCSQFLGTQYLVEKINRS